MSLLQTTTIAPPSFASPPPFPSAQSPLGGSPGSFLATYEQPLVATLVALDGTICVLTLPLSLMILAVLAKTSILHRNLKLVLLAESGGILLRALSRLSWITENLANKAALTIFPTGSYIVYNLVTAFRNFVGHILILERIFATVYAKKYEHYKQPYFSIAWITVDLVFSFSSLASFIQAATISNSAITNSSTSTNFSSQPQRPEPNTTSSIAPAAHPSSSLFTTFVLNFALILLTAFEIFIFYKLLVYNHKKYVGFKQRNSGIDQQQSLSERYQISENIRTARQLLPVMWLHLLNMINATFAYGVLYFQSIDMTLYNTVIATLQMILASLIGLTIEAIIIKFHPLLNRRVRKWIRVPLAVVYRHNQVGPAVSTAAESNMPQTAAGQGQGPHGHQQHRVSLPQVSTGSAPLTITGKPLIERGDQMQEHFQQLDVLWSRLPDNDCGAGDGGKEKKPKKEQPLPPPPPSQQQQQKQE